MVREVAARLRPAMPGIGFALESVVGFRREDGYATRFDGGLEERVAPFEELLLDTPPMVKVLASARGPQRRDGRDRRRELGDLVT